jgi:hypothetical protein
VFVTVSIAAETCCTDMVPSCITIKTRLRKKRPSKDIPTLVAIEIFPREVELLPQTKTVWSNNSPFQDYIDVICRKQAWKIASWLQARPLKHLVSHFETIPILY